VHVPPERRQEAHAVSAQTAVAHHPYVARQPDHVAGQELLGAQLRLPCGELALERRAAAHAHLASVREAVGPAADHIVQCRDVARDRRAPAVGLSATSPSQPL
jgi:hypothetical protein